MFFFNVTSHVLFTAQLKQDSNIYCISIFFSDDDPELIAEWNAAFGMNAQNRNEC